MGQKFCFVVSSWHADEIEDTGVEPADPLGQTPMTI